MASHLVLRALAAGVLLVLLAAPAGAVTAPPAFAGCSVSAPEVRPTFILLGCGDGGQYLADLRWSRWTDEDAVGSAVWWRNLCTPDCVAGHFARSRASVRLFRPRPCGKDRRELFTRMTLRIVGARPPEAAKATVTVKSPFAGGGVCP